MHPFTLTQDPRHPSEVAVELAPGARRGESTVRLAHGGRTEASAAARETFGDWPLLLDRFVALAGAAAD